MASTPMKQRVMKYLGAHPGWHTGQEIADALGVKLNVISPTLTMAAQDSVLQLRTENRKQPDGRMRKFNTYRVPDSDPHEAFALLIGRAPTAIQGARLVAERHSGRGGITPLSLPARVSTLGMACYG